MFKCFDCDFSSVDLTSFAYVLYLGLIPPSLILAKRLIASLNITRGFGNMSPIILSNLEVRSSVISGGGGGTKDLVVYVKVSWQPLTNVGDQSDLE